VEEVLKEAAENPFEVFTLFEDEASFYRQPTQGLLWHWMGRKQPQMRYTHKSNTVMRVMGVLNAVNGRVYCEDTGSTTAERLGEFFKRVLSLYKGARKIYIIGDNWPVHYHKAVTRVLNSDTRVEIVPLPTYSPWLNKIEKVWKLTKQEVTHAHPWSDNFIEFRRQVRNHFLTLEKRPMEVLRYVGGV